MATTSNEQRLMEQIARMVDRGGMRHEHPGQYYGGPAKPQDFPEYDVAQIAQAFPDHLEIHFDDEQDPDGKVIGTVLTMADGDGPDVVIPLGAQVPATTDELIERIRTHLRGEFDLESLKATEDAFAEFGDDPQD